MAHGLPSPCSHLSGFPFHVPGFEEPVCFVENKDPQALVDQMMSCLDQMVDVVFDKQMEIFEPVFVDIDQTLSDITQNDFAHESHPLHKLKEKLEQRVRVLTLCGFNSGKYDLSLVRAYLFKWLKQAGYQPSIIKRDNNYLMISTNKFRFLDISNFIAVGHSYEYYLKAFDVPDSKAVVMSGSSQPRN